MSILEQSERARQVARRRRAHLSTRAILAALLRLGERLRARLDPSGGAEDPALRRVRAAGSRRRS